MREVSKASYSGLHGGCANCECSLDYLFQLAVEMKQLGLPWISNVSKVVTSSGR